MKVSNEDFLTIAKIAERSEKMKVGFGERITRIMDLEIAHEKFNLKLEEFLGAEDMDFIHDFCGIQERIDRYNKKWEDEFFLPRFANVE